MVEESVYREFSRRYKPSKNDIIITRVGSYGISALVDDTNFCLGQNTSAIVPKVNPRYLYYALNSLSVKRQIEFSVVGSTQKTLSLKSINSLEIPRFGEVIEDKIAEIIGSIDDNIELNSKINQTLEQMVQTIFKSWFVDFEPVKAKIEAKIKGRDPERAAMCAISGKFDAELDQLPTEQRQDIAATAALFPDELEESELGLIPKGWVVSTIGYIADVIDCLHSKKPNQLNENTGNILLQLNNIGDDGLLYLNGKYYITDVEYQKWISRIEVTVGDCIITNVGRVGAVATVPPGIKAAIGRNMTAIRLKRKFPYPAFLATLLASDFFKQEIASKTDVGTILDALNVRNIPKLQFYYPGHDLLREYEDTYAPLLRQRQICVSQSEALSNTRDALLPKLLSGDIKLS
jgi:type I restriction enzyme S subunit